MATTGLTSYFGPVRNPWNGDYVTGQLVGWFGGCGGRRAVFRDGRHGCCSLGASPGRVLWRGGLQGQLGLISAKGILGDQPVDDFIRWMAHAAVTTRGAADTALVLNVLADRGDDFAAGVARASTAVRIGVPGDNSPRIPRSSGPLTEP